MELDHDTLVWFSKSFGLFYLIALSLIVVVYAYWPSNKKQFDRRCEVHPRRRGQAMAVEERDPHTGYHDHRP